MAEITFRKKPTHTSGNLPEVGTFLKDFHLTGNDLSEVALGHFSGKKKILSIVPSLDTSLCAASTKKFNEEAAKLEGTALLVISADLPFAQKRFCETEGIKNIQVLSSFRSSFPEDYGVRIADGPLRGLNARAVIITDENNKVIYTQLLSEITEAPDYTAAINTIKEIS